MGVREDFDAFLDSIDFQNNFWSVHRNRYLASGEAVFRAVSQIEKRENAIEIGASYAFAEWLRGPLGFSRVDATDYQPNTDARIVTINSPFVVNGQRFPFNAYNVDLESQHFDTVDETYDLATCFEVIEHMDVDPMWFMTEANRVIRTGGFLIMSTPNSTSSQIVSATLHGYAPQLYMYYQRDRSPFRHNFEYAPNQIRQLVEAAGFEIVDFRTIDTFNPPAEAALKLLSDNGFPTEHRGDNMFIVARKIGPVKDRYPDMIYDGRW